MERFLKKKATPPAPTPVTDPQEEPQPDEEVETFEEYGDLAPTLRKAKIMKELDEDTWKEVHRLHFGPSFAPNNYSLIEVEEWMVDHLVAGKELVVRGDFSDNVALSTEDQTFDLKEMEGSNAYMLSFDMKLPESSENQSYYSTKANLESMQYSYVCIGDLPITFSGRLRPTLEQHVLDLYDDERDATSGGLTWTMLLREIQLSEAQLRKAVSELPVIEHAGNLWQLSWSSISRILDEVIQLCEDPLFPEVTVSNITKKELRKNLSDFVVDGAIEWIINALCIKNDDEESYSLSPAAVCRARAAEVLRSADNSTLPRTKFETLMCRMLPEGMQLDYECLRGVAVCHESPTRPTIQYLGMDLMPPTPQERLAFIFSVKEDWTKNEILPYITDFCSSAMKPDAFLMKYTRCVFENNEMHCYLKNA